MLEEALTEAADGFARIADRYAAELIDKLGVPISREEAATAIAVAYLDGAVAQLKWARDIRRGDEPRALHSVKS